MTMRRLLLTTLFIILSRLLPTYATCISFPFPILGGELSNSAATSVADIDEVMPRMRALGLNTVLVPVYWELMEPQEGRYDFTLVDCTIDKARACNLKVIFLWFGAWKNSMSCYAPSWFKQDVKRFPRAMTSAGKPLEIASCFSENVLQADNRAFGALMRHISEKDEGVGTVIMMQIENEIGMLEDARDHSPLAEKAYRSTIPAKLCKLWKLGRSVTWKETFGDDIYGEEKFMAWHYACYVEQLAQTARSILPKMPLYVNAAMNSRGRKPGEYPSAGPLAHLIDIWHQGAPSIDLLAPDIYDTGFIGWALQYALPGNQLFVPESRCCENSGVRALYCFGEHRALGFSPFAIDQAAPHETASVTKAYGLLRQLSYINEGLTMTNEKSSNAKGIPSREPSSFLLPSSLKTWGLLFDQEEKERVIDDDGVVMTCRHYFTLPWDPRATDGSVWQEGGAMLVRLAKHEYLLAGSGIVVDFKTLTEKRQEEKKVLGEDGFTLANEKSGMKDEESANITDSPSSGPSFKGRRLGLLSVDEVSVNEDGTFMYLRRDNGDQTHQGRHVRISVGDWKILHIRLYEYE